MLYGSCTRGGGGRGPGGEGVFTVVGGTCRRALRPDARNIRFTGYVGVRRPRCRGRGGWGGGRAAGG